MSATAEEVEGEVEASEFAWPEDWRQRIAGEDEKELAHIGKYATPADIWTKTRALEQRLSSGEFKQVSPYPEKGTADEQAQWRESNKIPPTYDKYELKREVAKEEKPVIDSFLEFAHGKNMSADNVNAMVDYFYDKYERDDEQQGLRDKELRTITEDELRVEWGNEYRTNLNKVESLVEMAGEDVKDILLDARLPNGALLRSNPAAMRFLLNAALIYNPTTTVVPQGGDMMSSIQDEIDTMKGKMNTKEYQQPGSKMRKRYRELIAERDKLSPGTAR